MGRTSDNRVFTVLLIPAGSGEESRTLRIPYRRLYRWAWAAGILATGLAVMFGSWWYLAARSARVNDLEAQVALFASDRERMAALARQLEELEAGYTQIRGLFGTEEADQPSPLWLPPAAGGRTGSGGDADQNLPTSWPLTVRGFVTQGLLEGGQTHPGLDIAVPAESYVRASGAGTVLEIGQDATYGNYIVIEHGEGYQTLYGHASITLVEADQPVRRNEVIALSGSTGRSTAPHLHFEITKDGTPVDPLDLVREP